MRAKRCQDCGEVNIGVTKCCECGATLGARKTHVRSATFVSKKDLWERIARLHGHLQTVVGLGVLEDDFEAEVRLVLDETYDKRIHDGGSDE